MLPRLVRRCWYTLAILAGASSQPATAPNGISNTKRAKRAPHGYAKVPAYTGERRPDGGWKYSTDSGWKLEPRVLAGCTCGFCRSRS